MFLEFESKTFIYQNVSIVVVHGDLTEEETDAIVCPANSYGHMKGGVAAVIRDKGGIEIEREAQAKAPIRVGRAVTTRAGSLKSRVVFHAPTMEEPIEIVDPRNVSAAMRAALHLAHRERVRSMSFPGMGTGTGALPYRDAATLMIHEIIEAVDREHTLHQVHLVAVSVELFDAFVSALAAALGYGVQAPSE